MSDLTDIKRCPSCGGVAELRAGWAFWVECTACDAEGDGYVSIEQAIDAWNEPVQAFKGWPGAE